MKAALLLFLFCLSAEADDIRWEFNELKRQLEGVEGQNKDMASRLSASETKIGELQARLSASETKTGELQSRLSASETKRENWHIADLTCYTGTGRNYRGTVSRTRSGITCQRWSSQTPHTHSRNPANFPFEGLENNFCRNPEETGVPWCYTNSQTRWETCDVPTCPHTIAPGVTCYSGTGRNYRGTVATTISGRTCQRWSSQTPHTHGRNPADWPFEGLDNNYCRNPDETGVPWCYTTDPQTRWETCPVPTC